MVKIRTSCSYLLISNTVTIMCQEPKIGSDAKLIRVKIRLDDVNDYRDTV